MADQCAIPRNQCVEMEALNFRPFFSNSEHPAYGKTISIG